MCKPVVAIDIRSEYKGINELVQRVWQGLVQSGDVDEALYRSTADTLYKATEEGYGKRLIELDYNTPDGTLLYSLRENVYVFSGMKTYQELRAMTGLMLDEKGMLRSEDEFTRLALKLHADYDERFLRAEYNNALVTSHAAARWLEIQESKDDLPLLRYVAILDDHTTSLCRNLHGIILPADHPFWRRYYIPNHWFERADIEQLAEGKETDLKGIGLPDLNPVFQGNAGTDGVIFPEKHPYFKVAQEHRQKAGQLFGLRIPEYSTRDLNKKEYAAWVDNIAKNMKDEGTARPVGYITSTVFSRLRDRGVDIDTTQLIINDKKILHSAREAKTARGTAVSIAELKQLISYIEKPEAILFDTVDTALIYVTTVGDKKLKIIAKPNRRVKIARSKQKVNLIVTLGKVESYNLRESRYEIWEGNILE